MNKTTILLWAILIFSGAAGLSAQQSGYVSWTSPAFASTLTGEDPVRKVYVALPPSYDKTGPERRYPVLYFLAGFGETLRDWVTGRYSFLDLAKDRMVQGSLKEMIIVLVDGKCKLDGSFYVNSPVTGNWEDFLAREVPEYVDRNYRTLAGPQGRAVAGHSMGGFGALNLALKHSKVFGTVYAHCPGLFAPDGLESSYLYKQANLKRLEDSFRSMEGKSPEDALPLYRSLVRNLMSNPGRNWEVMVLLAYASVFSPRTDAPPYARLALSGDRKVLDPEALELWRKGFGGWEEKVAAHLPGLKALRGIGLMYAREDYFSWISAGTRHLSQVLKAQGVSHVLQEVPGDHETDMEDRFRDYLLPFVSVHLDSGL